MSVYDISGLAGSCDVILKSILYIKDCMKKDKEISKLLEDAEREVIRIFGTLLELALLVQLQGVKMGCFRRILLDLQGIGNDLKILKERLSNESTHSVPFHFNIRKCIKRISRFFNAPNIADAFQSIIDNLKTTGEGIVSVTTMGSIDLKLSIVLESLAREADLSSCEEDVRKLLSQAQKYFSTQEIANRIDRIISGTEESTSLLFLNMGKLYSDGAHIDIDNSKSDLYFRMAFDNGSSESCYYLGKQFIEGIGGPRDEEEGFKYFRVGRERGDIRSLYEFGCCLLNGIGVEKDQEAGFAHISQAAASGNANAINMVGCCFERGTGTTLDLIKANENYMKAAESGNPVALVNLGNSFITGRGVEKNEKLGKELYQLGADFGEKKGFLGLGHCYTYGQGVEPDLNEAIRNYEEAMNRNCTAAKARVGFCYVNGEGVEKDEPKGFELIKEAAEIDDREAAYWFGYVLQYGLGTGENVEEAIKWHQRGAAAGDRRCNYSLGEIYRIGDGVDQNIDEAVKHYKEAAEYNDPDAHLELARLSENGEESRKHYRLAAYLGNEEARSTVARYMFSGPPPPCLKITSQEINKLIQKVVAEEKIKRFRSRMDTRSTIEASSMDESARNLIVQHAFGEQIFENMPAAINEHSTSVRERRSFWSHRYVQKALLFNLCITIFYLIFKLGEIFATRNHMARHNFVFL